MLSKRIVHLDLKGGPPKVSYLLNILPILKSWGVTGLLIEYEDTFCYQNELSILSSKNAYSKDEILSILHCCKLLSLEVIPLIQTFGHLEFVLKHRQFVNCRENENYHNCLCPSATDAFELLCKMLDQILSVHQDMKWIHIGCDEVWHLGSCEKCSDYLFASKLTKSSLFLQHVRRIGAFLKSRNPDLNVIMWDDMLRNMDMHDLINSNIADVIEPMVWYYGTGPFPGHLLPNFSKVFKRVWGATAFKGASGCTKTVPNLEMHVENHKLWLAVIRDERINGARVEGIVLTGWSRYDHYAVLCELLPAGLPSLALCVTILKNAHCEASTLLGLNEKLPLCHKNEELVDFLNFPGREIYRISIAQQKLLDRFKNFVGSDIYHGWFNKFNVERNFINPVMYDQLVSEARNLLNHFSELKAIAQAELNEIYDHQVTMEWMKQHLEIYMEKLNKISAIKSNEFCE